MSDAGRFIKVQEQMERDIRLVIEAARRRP